jgi:hypothetical protein
MALGRFDLPYDLLQLLLPALPADDEGNLGGEKDYISTMTLISK